MTQTAGINPFPLGSHWLMLAISGVLLLSVALLVDLNPVVDQNFFFSTNDPGISKPKRSSNVFRRNQK
jgi:hypothetical protein